MEKYISKIGKNVKKKKLNIIVLDTYFKTRSM